MNDQVLSIKQMQELIKLGIDISTASMCWIGCSDGNDVYPYNKTFRKCFEEHLDTIPLVLTPTFTLQDVLEMLPVDIIENDEFHPTIINDGGCFTILYMANDGTRHPENPKFTSYNVMETAFNMLKWLKENNHM